MASGEIESLVTLLEIQRSRLSVSKKALSDELNLSTQVKRSVRAKPKAWILTGAGSIAFLSLLFRRKTVVKVNKSPKRGLIGTIFTLAIALAKPAITRYGMAYAKEYARKKIDPDNTLPLFARQDRL